MQFISLISNWREGALIGAGVVALVLFLWFLARLSHRPYVIQGRSEFEQMTAFQMGRIADGIERLNRALESRAPLEGNKAPASTEARPKSMDLSMLGR